MSDLVEHDETPATVSGVGDILRSTREAGGHTVADVAQALKLTQRQVEALESERFELLPGVAFARGFLRNYARLLGLDPEPLLQSLAQTDGVGAPELAPVCNAEGTMPAGDGGPKPFATLIALVAVILLGAVVLGWYFDWFAQPRETTDTAEAIDTPVAPAAVTPVPPSLDANPVVIPDDAPAGAVPMAPPPGPVMPTEDGNPAPQTAVPAGEAGASAETSPAASEAADEVAEPVASTDQDASADERRLVFRFDGDSWVEVRDGAGKIIFSRTNRAGSVQEVQGEPPFSLVIGNARDVNLQYKGEAVDLVPHTKVSVARLTLE